MRRTYLTPFSRFDPDAIDGDNDGLVQDNTSFERPDNQLGRLARFRKPQRLRVPKGRPKARKIKRGRRNLGAYNPTDDETYDEMLGPRPPRRNLETGRSRAQNLPTPRYQSPFPPGYKPPRVQRGYRPPKPKEELPLASEADGIQIREVMELTGLSRGAIMKRIESGLVPDAVRVQGRRGPEWRIPLDSAKKITLNIGMPLASEVDGLTIPEVTKLTGLPYGTIMYKIKRGEVPGAILVQGRHTPEWRIPLDAAKKITRTPPGRRKRVSGSMATDKKKPKPKIVGPTMDDRLSVNPRKFRTKPRDPSQRRMKAGYIKERSIELYDEGYTVSEIAEELQVNPGSVARHLRNAGISSDTRDIAPKPKKNPRRVSGSMSWGAFNPPRPGQNRSVPDFDPDLPEPDFSGDDNVRETPRTYTVPSISMRQWNEFSSDMISYLQESLGSEDFAYGDSKDRARERRRSLLKAVAIIKNANARKDQDDNLLLDLREDEIRRLRTVLRAMQEQEVENVRHIQSLRDNLPNRGRKSLVWGVPTRYVYEINIKDVLGQPRKIRTSDPDVFEDRASAFVRSRQLGCIGIRQYSTVDGSVAWMPCTNESDYRRRTGVGPMAARDRKRREEAMAARISRSVERRLRKKCVNIKPEVILTKDDFVLRENMVDGIRRYVIKKLER